MCDVDPDTFNVTTEYIEPLITKKTKAIVPVHLYGQSCEMAPIIKLAKKYNLKIIEDNAQAIGCKYTFSPSSNFLSTSHSLYLSNSHTQISMRSAISS